MAEFQSLLDQAPVVNDPEFAAFNRRVAKEYRARADARLDETYTNPNVAGSVAANLAVEEGLRSAGRYAKDLGVAGMKGLVGLGETAVGLADLTSPLGRYGAAGKFVKEGLGVDLKGAKEYWDQFRSDDSRRREQEFADTKGFFNAAGQALSDPLLLGEVAVESLPGMVAGGFAGKALVPLASRVTGAVLPKVLPKLTAETVKAAGPAAAFGAGEGLITAGQMAESVRQQTEDGYLTPKQAALSAAAGTITGLIGAASAGVARKFGITNLEEWLVGASPSAKRHFFSNVVKSAAAESGEEFLQSGQEAIANNLALGKPWEEGVKEQAALGMVVGAAMGGAVGGIDSHLGATERANEERRKKFQAEHDRVQKLYNPGATPPPLPAPKTPPPLPPAAPSSGAPPAGAPALTADAPSGGGSSLKVGDRVDTPQGPGVIVSFKGNDAEIKLDAAAPAAPTVQQSLPVTPTPTPVAPAPTPTPVAPKKLDLAAAERGAKWATSINDGTATVGRTSQEAWADFASRTTSKDPLEKAAAEWLLENYMLGTKGKDKGRAVGKTAASKPAKAPVSKALEKNSTWNTDLDAELDQLTSAEENAASAGVTLSKKQLARLAELRALKAATPATPAPTPAPKPVAPAPVPVPPQKAPETGGKKPEPAKYNFKAGDKVAYEGNKHITRGVVVETDKGLRVKFTDPLGEMIGPLHDGWKPDAEVLSPEVAGAAPVSYDEFVAFIDQGSTKSGRGGKTVSVKVSEVVSPELMRRAYSLTERLRAQLASRGLDPDGSSSNLTAETQATQFISGSLVLLGRKLAAVKTGRKGADPAAPAAALKQLEERLADAEALLAKPEPVKPAPAPAPTPAADPLAQAKENFVQEFPEYEPGSVLTWLENMVKVGTKDGATPQDVLVRAHFVLLGFRETRPKIDADLTSRFGRTLPTQMRLTPGLGGMEIHTEFQGDDIRFTLGVNPVVFWADYGNAEKLSESLRKTASEEMFHVLVTEVLHKDWVKAERPGTFEQYSQAWSKSILGEMGKNKDLLEFIKRAYPADPKLTEAQQNQVWADEWVRMVLQYAYEGSTTEVATRFVSKDAVLDAMLKSRVDKKPITPFEKLGRQLRQFLSKFFSSLQDKGTGLPLLAQMQKQVDALLAAPKKVSKKSPNDIGRSLQRVEKKAVVLPEDKADAREKKYAENTVALEKKYMTADGSVPLEVKLFNSIDSMVATWGHDPSSELVHRAKADVLQWLVDYKGKDPEKYFWSKVKDSLRARSQTSAGGMINLTGIDVPNIKGFPKRKQDHMTKAGKDAHLVKVRAFRNAHPEHADEINAYLDKVVAALGAELGLDASGSGDRSVHESVPDISALTGAEHAASKEDELVYQLARRLFVYDLMGIKTPTRDKLEAFLSQEPKPRLDGPEAKALALELVAEAKARKGESVKLLSPMGNALGETQRSLDMEGAEDLIDHVVKASFGFAKLTPLETAQFATWSEKDPARFNDLAKLRELARHVYDPASLQDVGGRATETLAPKQAQPKVPKEVPELEYGYWVTPDGVMLPTKNHINLAHELIQRKVQLGELTQEYYNQYLNNIYELMEELGYLRMVRETSKDYSFDGQKPNQAQRRILELFGIWREKNITHYGSGGKAGGGMFYSVPEPEGGGGWFSLRPKRAQAPRTLPDATPLLEALNRAYEASLAPMLKAMSDQDEGRLEDRLYYQELTKLKEAVALVNRNRIPGDEENPAATLLDGDLATRAAEAFLEENPRGVVPDNFVADLTELQNRLAPEIRARSAMRLMLARDELKVLIGSLIYNPEAQVAKPHPAAKFQQELADIEAKLEETNPDVMARAQELYDHANGATDRAATARALSNPYVVGLSSVTEITGEEATRQMAGDPEDLAAMLRDQWTKLGVAPDKSLEDSEAYNRFLDASERASFGITSMLSGLTRAHMNPQGPTLVALSRYFQRFDFLRRALKTSSATERENVMAEIGRMRTELAAAEREQALADIFNDGVVKTLAGKKGVPGAPISKAELLLLTNYKQGILKLLEHAREAMEEPGTTPSQKKLAAERLLALIENQQTQPAFRAPELQAFEITQEALAILQNAIIGDSAEQYKARQAMSDFIRKINRLPPFRLEKLAELMRIAKIAEENAAKAEGDDVKEANAAFAAARMQLANEERRLLSQTEARSRHATARIEELNKNIEARLLRLQSLSKANELFDSLASNKDFNFARVMSLMSDNALVRPMIFDEAQSGALTFRGFKHPEKSEAQEQLVGYDVDYDRYIARIKKWFDSAHDYVSTYDAQMAQYLAGIGPSPEEAGYDTRVYQGLRIAIERDEKIYLTPDIFAHDTVGTPGFQSDANAWYQSLIAILQNVPKFLPAGVPKARLSRSIGNVAQMFKNIRAVFVEYGRPIPGQTESWLHAIDSATKAHGFGTKEEYYDRVMRPAAAYARTPTGVKVGQFIPETGVTLMKEDLRVLRVLSQIQSRVFRFRQQWQDKATLETPPEGGDVSRFATSNWQFTLPRRIGALAYAVKNRILKLGDKVLEPTDDFSSADETTPAGFWNKELVSETNSVLSHIMSSLLLPSKQRKMEQSTTMRNIEAALAAKLAAKEIAPDSLRTLEDLVDALVELAPDSLADPRTFVRTQLAAELNQYQKATSSIGLNNPTGDLTVATAADFQQLARDDNQFNNPEEPLALPAVWYEWGFFEQAGAHQTQVNANMAGIIELFNALTQAHAEVSELIANDDANPGSSFGPYLDRSRAVNAKMALDGVLKSINGIVGPADAGLPLSLQPTLHRFITGSFNLAVKFALTSFMSILNNVATTPYNVARLAVSHHPGSFPVALTAGTYAALKYYRYSFGKLGSLIFNKARMTAVLGAMKLMGHPISGATADSWLQAAYKRALTAEMNYRDIVEIGQAERIQFSERVRLAAAEAQRPTFKQDLVRMGRLSRAARLAFGLLDAYTSSAGVTVTDAPTNYGASKVMIDALETSLRTLALRWYMVRAGLGDYNPSDPTTWAVNDEDLKIAGLPGSKSRLRELKNELALVGLPHLESLLWDYHLRRREAELSGKDPHAVKVFTDEQWRMLAQQMSGNVNVGDPTNRSLTVQANRKFAAMATLMGWALHNTSSIMLSPGMLDKRGANFLHHFKSVESYSMLASIVFAAMLFGSLADAAGELFRRWVQNRKRRYLTLVDKETYTSFGNFSDVLMRGGLRTVAVPFAGEAVRALYDKELFSGRSLDASSRMMPSAFYHNVLNTILEAGTALMQIHPSALLDSSKSMPERLAYATQGVGGRLVTAGVSAAERMNIGPSKEIRGILSRFGIDPGYRLDRRQRQDEAAFMMTAIPENKKSKSFMSNLRAPDKWSYIGTMLVDGATNNDLVMVTRATLLAQREAEFENRERAAAGAAPMDLADKMRAVVASQIPLRRDTKYPLTTSDVARIQAASTPESWSNLQQRVGAIDAVNRMYGGRGASLVSDRTLPAASADVSDSPRGGGGGGGSPRTLSTASRSRTRNRLRARSVSRDRVRRASTGKLRIRSLRPVRNRLRKTIR